MGLSRAALYGRAAVASSQPLATTAGLEILRQGGNAADAAVAVASALAVTEPCSNGIGGDCIALVYEAKDRQVKAVHGVGPSPEGLSLAEAQAACDPTFPTRLSPSCAQAVTAPGALAGWRALLDGFGSSAISLERILAPAIKLAKRGFPVAHGTAAAWASASEMLSRNSECSRVFLPERRAPKCGEVFFNADLANVLERVANKGITAGFYEGPIADAIAASVRENGGQMTAEDVRAADPALVRSALKTRFRNVDVHEVGSPTHGVAVLEALNIVEAVAPDGLRELGGRFDEVVTHTLVDSLRVAYADVAAVVAEGSCEEDVLLADKQHAMVRAQEFMGETRASLRHVAGGMRRGGTVQFVVVDVDGNAVSMVQSNFCGFGTPIVPKACGFTLHNRGLGFSLDPAHPNCAGPRKRPYHTIIPGLLTNSNDGTLRAAFGCMGSFMQPQGHVQIVTSLVDYDQDAQAAVEAPRFRIRGEFGRAEAESGDDVALESGLEHARAALKARGHDVVEDSSGLFFGRAQVVTRDVHGIVCAGSDHRADGTASVL